MKSCSISKYVDDEVDIEIDEDDVVYWLDYQTEEDQIKFHKNCLIKLEPENNKNYLHLDETLKQEWWENIKNKFTLSQLEEKFK